MWRPCLLTIRKEVSILYTGHSIGAFYQVAVHLAKWFQRRIIFRNQPFRKKNCMWQPCLLKDRN